MAVQQRAKSLVSQLWARGNGASKIELTGGRWIAFRAELVRGGKKGVVAYRTKRKQLPGGTAAAPAPATPATPAANIPTATAPAAAERTIKLRKGLTYRFVAKLELPEGVALEGVAKGLAAAGATEIKIDAGPPIIARYTNKAAGDGELILNRRIRIDVGGGNVFYMTLLEVKEVLPSGTLVTSPGQPQAVPSILTSAAAAASPIISQLPDLKFGDGIAPKPPNENVKIVQRRLRIKDDGQFGDGTRNAVIAFQVQTGLAPKLPLEQLRARGFGAVKRATWEKLLSVQA